MAQLEPHHFYEGIHARIFEAIIDLAAGGKIISPLILKSRFEQDATLAEIGGTQYLSRLLGAAGPLIGVKDYARLIRELADRRAVMAACEETRQRSAIITGVNGSDFRNALSDHIAELTSVFDGGRERKTTFTAAEAANDSIARMERMQAGKSDPTAIPTGIAGLDKITPARGRATFGNSSNSQLVNAVSPTEKLVVPFLAFLQFQQRRGLKHSADTHSDLKAVFRSACHQAAA